MDSGRPFGATNEVLAGFVRIVTHSRVFHPPEPVEGALAFAEALRGCPGFVPVGAGARHWENFASLCHRVRPAGDVVWDAYHAAVAIENGSEWVTTDADFAKFPGLRWTNPLTGHGD
jgi:hypothetical protein